MSKIRTISIKGKEYVPVDERLRVFHRDFRGHIETKLVSTDTCIDQLTGKECERYVVKANVYPYSLEFDADENTRTISFSGLAVELSSQGYINKTSALENCETSAVGRALGMLGIGIDYGIASSQEVMNAVKSQDMAMARPTDYDRVDKKVKMAFDYKLISKEQRIDYKRFRSEGMLKTDLFKMEERIDKMLGEHNGGV